MTKLIVSLLALFPMGFAAADDVRLTVKFHDELRVGVDASMLRFDSNLEDAVSPIPQEIFAFDQIPAARWSAVHSLLWDESRRLQEQGERRTGGSLPNLATTFYLTIDETQLEAVSSVLESSALVDWWHLSPTIALPATPPNYQGNQIYLQNPAVGTGASAVWSATGSTGAGVTIGVIELGFNPNHLDRLCPSLMVTRRDYKVTSSTERRLSGFLPH